MKKFVISPYWLKQKRSRAVQVWFSSTGSMEYLGNQEVASVAPHYIALYQIPTKKSETFMRMLHTLAKVQLLLFATSRRRQRPYSRIGHLAGHDSYRAPDPASMGKQRLMWLASPLIPS